MKYRKKPIVIEAIQWTTDNLDEVKEFLGPTISSEIIITSIVCNTHDYLGIMIRTLEGHMTVAPYDYIIRGVKGELYPCKPDIFEITYEPVPD